jgi:lipoprotein-anchoring transpeptidase ErfK/SrfK
MLGAAGPGRLLLAVLGVAPVQTRAAPPWPALERADVFEGVSSETEVVGRPQKVIARHEDTFTDIARRFNLGYDELRAANPGIDPWIPGEGTEILLPTAHVIPDGPREGVVINLPAMRLWWFGPPDDKGRQTVITHPIGIGKLGWATPLGEFHVISGQGPDLASAGLGAPRACGGGRPVAGRGAAGARQPARPACRAADNPVYLLHGTNKPAGVGMRVSHGCIRLYPGGHRGAVRPAADGHAGADGGPALAGRLAGRPLLFEAHGQPRGRPRRLDDRPGDAAARAGEHALDWPRAAAIRRRDGRAAAGQRRAARRRSSGWRGAARSRTARAATSANRGRTRARALTRARQV